MAVPFVEEWLTTVSQLTHFSRPASYPPFSQKVCSLATSTVEPCRNVFFGHLVLHRLPEYWKNPREFIPERWANGSKDITPFTYLPFVAGPRVCMGKHLAMLSMKLALVYTFKEHDMRPIPGEENVMDWDYRFTIVRPTKGYHVIFDKAN